MRPYELQGKSVVVWGRGREGKAAVDFLQSAGVSRLEVVDDGSGIDEDAPPGVGMAAMRERAAEVGGSCTVAPADGRGTRVLAVLPLEGP